MGVGLEMIVPFAIRGAGHLPYVRGRKDMGSKAWAQLGSIRFVSPRESSIHSNDSDEPPINGMYDGTGGYLC